MGVFMKLKLENKKYIIPYAIIFNLIIMTFVMLVVKVYYENSDDVTIVQHVIDGYYNIAFVSWFFTKTLSFLQKIIYPLNAYTWYLLLMALASTSTITKIFIDKFGYKKATIMMIVFNGIFAVNYYSSMSFTRITALIAITGFFSIIHHTRQEKWLAGTIWGIVLVVLSSFIRFQCFELCLGLAVAFVGALSINDFFDVEKDIRKFADLIKIIFEPKRLCSVILIIAIAFSLSYISTNIKKSNEEFVEYRQYTSARSTIYDYEIPDYDDAFEEYDKLGIDENDIDCLRYGFYDKDVAFPIDRLEELSNLSSKGRFSGSLFDLAKQMIKNEAIGIITMSIEGIGVIAVAILLLLCFILNDKKYFLAPVIIGMAIIVLYSYLYYKGRVVYRVTYPIILASSLFLMYLFNFEKIHKIKINTHIKNIIVGTCALVVFVTGIYITAPKNEHFRESYYPSTVNELSDYMKENSGSTFEIIRGKNIHYWFFDNLVENPLLVSHWDYDSNYLESNCTYYDSPYYNSRLKSLGIDNPYANMLKNGVYVVAETEMGEYDTVDMLQKFLQKYYSNGKTVNVEIVEQLTDYTVYNYTLS